MPEKKIRVIPNGTDLSKYKPDPALGTETRRSLGILDEDPVLAFDQERPVSRRLAETP